MPSWHEHVHACVSLRTTKLDTSPEFAKIAHYVIVTAAEQIDQIVFGAEDLMANTDGCVQLIRVNETEPGVDNYCYIESFSG